LFDKILKISIFFSLQIDLQKKTEKRAFKMKKNQKQKKPAMYLLLVLSATSFNLYAEHPISVSAVYSYDFMRNTPNAVVLDAATMKPILLQEIAEKALLETFG